MSNKILVTTLLLAMFGLGERLEAIIPIPDTKYNGLIEALRQTLDLNPELITLADKTYQQARTEATKRHPNRKRVRQLYQNAGINLEKLVAAYEACGEQSENNLRLLNVLVANCWLSSADNFEGNSSAARSKKYSLMNNAALFYSYAGYFEDAGDVMVDAAVFAGSLSSRIEPYQQALKYYNKASTSARLDSKIAEVNRLLAEAREEDAAQSERVRDAGRPRSTRRDLQEGEYQPGQGFYYGTDETTGRRIFEMNPRHR